jgi:hypothetical protein
VDPKSVRNKAQKYRDPIAAIVAAVVGILVSIGVFDRLGLEGDAIAALESAAISLGAAIYMVVDRNRDKRIASDVQSIEDGAYHRGVVEGARRVIREGVEGGTIDPSDIDTDKILIEGDPNRVKREG